MQRKKLSKFNLIQIKGNILTYRKNEEDRFAISQQELQKHFYSQIFWYQTRTQDAPTIFLQIKELFWWKDGFKEPKFTKPRDLKSRLKKKNPHHGRTKNSNLPESCYRKTRKNTILGEKHIFGKQSFYFSFIPFFSFNPIT